MKLQPYLDMALVREVERLTEELRELGVPERTLLVPGSIVVDQPDGCRPPGTHVWPVTNLGGAA